MKRLNLWIFVGLFLVIGLALVLAMNMGEKSPIFASGTIQISDDVAPHAKAIKTLYLIIYDAGSEMPMPYGAVREILADGATGEIAFLITQEKLQVMNEARPRPQMLRIKARLDLDGVAGMDQVGDLVGEVAGVPFGATDVRFAIDKRIGSH